VNFRKWSVGLSFLLLAAVTYFLIKVPVPQVSLPTPFAAQPPDGLAASNVIAVGAFLKFYVPQSVTVHASDSPDATVYTISAPDGKATLKIGEGFAWVEHADEFEPEANNRQVRRATYGGGLEVIDVKVVKMDGTRSRLISTIGESAKYESASAAAASFFDSILDTLCFNDPIRLENWRGQPRLLDCSEYILEVFGQERCVRR